MERLYLRIDELNEALQARLATNEAAALPLLQRLDSSWVYHDNALEGVVLSYHELNSALDDAIISDSSLIPQYDDLRNLKTAIGFLRTAALRRKPPLTLEFIKRLHQILCTEPGTPKTSRGASSPALQYRKDNPLHRQYFHEIAPPEKIAYLMRKLSQWLASAEARKLHPIRRAATAHHKLIAIYPWPRHSGRVSRLLMNALLLRDGLPPAIIHAVERHRYYEVLRQPTAALTELVAESLTRTLESSQKLFDDPQVRAAS
ncbi:MAG: Fic family protein [Proteobacteria bacterium]|nr:Fic family protein [Pseudomonadota bacterium]